MRRFVMLACAAALGVSLSTTCAGAALASAKSPASSSRRWLIVVSPGQSIQAAVNRARPGFTILLRPGVYHQSIQIRTSGISLLGSGNSTARHRPEAAAPHTAHRVQPRVRRRPGICVLAKKVNLKNGQVIKPVRNVSIRAPAGRELPRQRRVRLRHPRPDRHPRHRRSTMAPTASRASIPLGRCSPTTSRSAATRPGSTSATRRTPTPW